MFGFVRPFVTAVTVPSTSAGAVGGGSGAVGGGAGSGGAGGPLAASEWALKPIHAWVDL